MYRCHAGESGVISMALYSSRRPGTLRVVVAEIEDEVVVVEVIVVTVVIVVVVVVATVVWQESLCNNFLSLFR